MAIYAVELLPGLLRIGFSNDIPTRFYARGFPFPASRACVLRLPEALNRVAERFAHQTMWCKGCCVAAVGRGGRRTTDWFRADIAVGVRALLATQQFLGGELESSEKLRLWEQEVASHRRALSEPLEQFLCRPLALSRRAYFLYAASPVRSAGVVVGVLPSSNREKWPGLSYRLAAASAPMSADRRSTLPIRCLAIPGGASPETYEALLRYLASRGAEPLKEVRSGSGTRLALFEKHWQPTISRCFGSLAKVLGGEFVVESRHDFCLP